MRERKYWQTSANFFFVTSFPSMSPRDGQQPIIQLCVNNNEKRSQTMAHIHQTLTRMGGPVQCSHLCGGEDDSASCCVVRNPGSAPSLLKSSLLTEGSPLLYKTQKLAMIGNMCVTSWISVASPFPFSTISRSLHLYFMVDDRAPFLSHRSARQCNNDQK